MNSFVVCGGVASGRLVRMSRDVGGNGVIIFPARAMCTVNMGKLSRGTVGELCRMGRESVAGPVGLVISSLRVVGVITGSVAPLRCGVVGRFLPNPLAVVLGGGSVMPGMLAGNKSAMNVEVPSGSVTLGLSGCDGMPVTTPDTGVSGEPDKAGVRDVCGSFRSGISVCVSSNRDGFNITSAVMGMRGGGVGVLERKIVALRSVVGGVDV